MQFNLLCKKSTYILVLIHMYVYDSSCMLVNRQQKKLSASLQCFTDFCRAWDQCYKRFFFLLLNLGGLDY